MTHNLRYQDPKFFGFHSDIRRIFFSRSVLHSLCPHDPWDSRILSLDPFFCFFFCLFISNGIRRKMFFSSDLSVFRSAQPRSDGFLTPYDPTVFNHPRSDGFLALQIRRFFIFHHPIPHGFLILKIKQVVEPGRSEQNSNRAMPNNYMILYTFFSKARSFQMKFYSLLFESNSLTSWAKVWLDDGADSFQAGFRAWEARNEGVAKNNAGGHCPITSTLTVHRLSQHIPSTLTVQLSPSTLTVQ